MPSVLATLAQGDAPSDFMAFALAAALRFLVPIGEQPRSAEHPPVFAGRCHPRPRPLAPPADATPSPASTPTAKRKRGMTEAASDPSATQAGPAAAAAAAVAGGAPYEYIPGLSASPVLGTYEFRDGDGLVPLVLRPLGAPSGCTAAGTSSALPPPAPRAVRAPCTPPVRTS